MFKIGYDKKITMVQGDTGVIRMRISNYELSQGDEVRFAIVNKANPSILLCQHSDKKIVLEKQVTVFEKDGSARIVIHPYDTEYLQPGKYLYEIQVKTKDGRIDTVVPLTSFTMMDGSIQGEFGQTTPSKPEPTPSEIELRFKRLENEIIPELGNRITNVEKDIDSIENKIIEVNVKDFGAKGDGTTDDTMAFIQFVEYVNKNQEEIYKVTVPSGKYIVNSVLRFEFLKNIQLYIDGEILFNGCNGIEFYFCESLKCNINKIQGVNNQSIDMITGTGIKFINSCFFDFTVNTIEYFRNAIYLSAVDLQPTYSLRGTYNLNIKFDHLKSCYTGIFILRDDVTSWINENRFFGGSFSGYNCIVQGETSATTPSTSSEYNRNTFENISFEQVQGNAINFYQANACLVKNCRAENPRKLGQYVIFEGQGAKQNLYDFGLSSIELDLIKLNLVDTIGSKIIGDIRKNTTIIGQEVCVLKNKIYITTKTISAEANGMNSISIIDTSGDFLFRFKRDDGKIINYFKLNRLTYTITQSDITESIITLPTKPLQFEEWQDGRILLTGRLTTSVSISKNTDLTENLLIDDNFKISNSVNINVLAYNYSSGECIPVCVTVRHDNHIITNTNIPANYIINFDNIVPIYKTNY